METVLLLTFFLVNIGFDLYQIQNNKGGKSQSKKSKIMDSAIFEEEIIELDEDELIVFLNEYYLINPSQLPKSEFY